MLLAPITTGLQSNCRRVHDRPRDTNGNLLQIFTHGIGINRLFCSNYNQPFDLPVQMIMGYSNDVFGAAAFRALDKQMKLQYQQNPTGLPGLSVSGAQKPGQDGAFYGLVGSSDAL